MLSVRPFVSDCASFGVEMCQHFLVNNILPALDGDGLLRWLLMLYTTTTIPASIVSQMALMMMLSGGSLAATVA